MAVCLFFFSSRRRHTRCLSDWSSDVCSSDLVDPALAYAATLVGASGLYRAGGAAAVAALAYGTKTLARVAKIGRASCRESIEAARHAAPYKKGRESHTHPPHEDTMTKSSAAP